MKYNEEYSEDEIYLKLYNDPELFKVLSKYGIAKTLDDFNYHEDDKERLRRVATLFYNNKVILLLKDIKALLLEEFLFKEIADIFLHTILPEPVYHTFFFVMKYGSVKNFFQKNYKNFMPEYDYYEIQSREKTRIFMDSFMREFDKFTAILDRIYDLADVDEAPDEYLDYLSRLIGYEKDYNYEKNDVFFRALLKNMIEVYKIKGTNYSIELFMSFLGFNITIYEYWFDRRYYFDTKGKNVFTGETNKNNFAFYLTPEKPTDFMPKDTTYRKIVNMNEFGEQRNLYAFNVMLDNNEATLEQLLGFEEEYTGPTYTYFKTSVAAYNIERIIASGSSVREEVTAKDINMIRKYLQFLTPIFVQNNIVITVIPYEDDYNTQFIFEDFIKFDLRHTYTNFALKAFFPIFPFVCESFRRTQEIKFEEKFKPKIKTIRDVYNSQVNVGGTVLYPRMSMHGRTAIDSNSYYGVSWEKNRPEGSVYEYISDAIYIKYEKV